MKPKKLKRFHWLAKIINEKQYTIGAEVGVYHGATAHRLLGTCPRLTKLICVDLWEYQPEVYSEEWERDMRRDENQTQVYMIFQRGIRGYENKVEILKGVSWEMAEKVDNKSLDFVFIDADHGYESVKKDILAWLPKVKNGGLISGHDINLPGVYQAVNEFFEESFVAGIDNVWFTWKN
jgi:predicted O-methyltransferase YrrM